MIKVANLGRTTHGAGKISKQTASDSRMAILARSEYLWVGVQGQV